MRTTLLAAGLGAAAVLMVVAAVSLTLDSGVDDAVDVAAFAVYLTLLSFPLTGAILAAQRPRNPIGWLYLAVGLSFFGTVALEEYARRALVTQPGSLPGGEVAGWLTMWLWIGWLALLPLAILIFPDGRLPSRRWRALVTAVAAWAAIQLVIEAFAAQHLTLDGLTHLPNPLAVAALAEVGAVREITSSAALAGVVAALAASALRLRRARGLERLQLRAFAYAAAVVTALGLLVVAVGVIGTAPGAVDALWILFIASLSGLPLASAVAILRYRLYDIDVLINRTLVYVSVSAALAAVYFGAILLLQPLLRPLTSGSELAVAGSTLLVVALFQPVRRRAQDSVDRRFYRARYDASRTLEAFAHRLRDTVDLAAVSDEMLGVVDATVRPSRASLWLRETSGNALRTPRS